MARKNRYQYDQNQDFDTTERVSRSQKKRESTALQELGASLAKLPLRELERLGISPDLLAAYRELSRITSREAKRRQMQYIGRLMREEDDTERLQEFGRDRKARRRGTLPNVGQHAPPFLRVLRKNPDLKPVLLA